MNGKADINTRVIKNMFYLIINVIDINNTSLILIEVDNEYLMDLHIMNIMIKS